MSAVRQRPRIQSVLIQVQATQAALNSQQVLQPTVQLSPSAQGVLQQVQQNLTDASHGLAAVGDRRQLAQTLQQQSVKLAQQAQLSLVETTQVTALATAAAYHTVQAQPLEQAWRSLSQSGHSLAAAQGALQSFTQTLETQHHQVICDHLATACNQAALQVGFQPLQPSVAPDGTLRLLASDESGRTLVTEIYTHPDRTLGMATEIIGSSDDTCEQILDAFDRTLAAAGVQSGPPERKFTGGICELAAAREFVQQRPLRPRSPSQPKVAPQQAHPRPMPPRSQGLQH